MSWLQASSDVPAEQTIPRDIRRIRDPSATKKPPLGAAFRCAAANGLQPVLRLELATPAMQDRLGVAVRLL
ncbi:hypothetical protein QVM11_29695, partial [Pseudomonas aeruginosa]